MLDSLYLYAECFALVTCIFTYKNLDSNYKRFLPYLLFIVCYELTCEIDFKIFIVHGTNAWINNFEYLLEFVFYSLFLRTLLKETPVYKIVIIFTAIVVLFSLINIFFIQGLWKLGTIGILLQYITLIFFICSYFYYLLQKADDELPLLKQPSFWVTCGLLFFFLIEFFYEAAFSFMAYNGNRLFLQINRVLSNIACVILYTFLGIALLCFRKPGEVDTSTKGSIM